MEKKMHTELVAPGISRARINYLGGSGQCFFEELW